MSLPLVHFTATWKGPFDLNFGGHTWQIRDLDFNRKYHTEINHQNSPSQPQVLGFGQYQIKERTYTDITIPYSIEDVKTIAVSARLFRPYSKKIKGPDGKMQTVNSERAKTVPVEMDPLPEFRPGDVYHICIMNENNMLKATFQNLQSYSQDFSSAQKTVRQHLNMGNFSGVDKILDALPYSQGKSQLIEEKMGALDNWVHLLRSQKMGEAEAQFDWLESLSLEQLNGEEERLTLEKVSYETAEILDEYEKWKNGAELLRISVLLGKISELRSETSSNLTWSLDDVIFLSLDDENKT